MLIASQQAQKYIRFVNDLVLSFSEVVMKQTPVKSYSLLTKPVSQTEPQNEGSDHSILKNTVL